MQSGMGEREPTVDPLTRQLTAVMVTLMKGSHSETMDVAMQYELTLSQLRTLFLLDRSDAPLAVNEIAEQINLSMPAAGRAIDALHRTDLVSRSEDPLDRRVKRIALTDRGSEAIASISASRLAAVQRLVDALSPEERAELQAATETLDAVVSTHLPSHPRHCAAGTAPTPHEAQESRA